MPSTTTLSSFDTQATPSSARLFGTSRAAGSGSASAAYTNAVANDSPLAYYRMNDLGPTMTDSSNNHLNGTFGSGVAHGGPVITATGDVSPTFGGGAYDTSMFATAPLNAMLQPQSAVSVETWIRPATTNTTGNYIPLISYGKQSQGPAYILMISPQNVLEFYAHTTASNGVHLEGYTPLKAATTYQVAATFDGTTAAIYINGQLEISGAGSGSLTYKNLNSHDGLGIGGSLDKGRPVFAGNISETSIYGRALSGASIQSHYIAGLPPVALVEHARTSASLIDMMGINTHLHYTGTTYDTQWPAIKQLLVNLGIRHIRDGLVDTTWKPYYARLNELGAAGIRSTLVTTFGQTPELLTSYPSRVSQTFEAYEPPNEPDLNDGSNWVADTRAFQKMMYSSVKSNPATANYRVFGPSPTNLQDFQALGDLSSYMDIGNFHEYFPGYNPGTDGYGSKSAYGTYGAIDWNMNVARIVDGNHLLAATEVGYNFAPGAMGNLPPDVGAKYLPRTFFEMFNRHMARAFIYQLADFESEAGFQCGLVSQNMTPKAPYNALKNLISVLHDPHPPAVTNTLSYSLSGNLANVHHTLLQMGDGSYDLALWIETRSVTPTQHSADGTRIDVPAQSVSLQLPTQPHMMTLEAFDNTGNVTNSVPPSVGVSTQVPVTDAITLVHFAL